MSVSLDLVPDQIFAGQFRVRRALARGGMGAVYVVEQLSTGKQRALKLMLPLSAQSVGHFEQEARTSCLIPSEHVVEVIDVGVDAATGAPWLCMELLEGEPLGDYLERMGALGAGETYEILQQLAHALSAAHDLPVVHRDLKPDNVFLARTRTELSAFLVKVLDFGLAKVVARQGSLNTMAMGTPLWMAPEQSEAEQPITCATDVWAFGLLAYRMLAGRDYWRALEVQPFLRELLVDPLVPASQRCAEQGGPLLPEGFDAWFARCVARSAEERFQHAQEAWRALEEVLSPHLVAVGASGAMRRPSWWPASRAPAAGPRGETLETFTARDVPGRTPAGTLQAALLDDSRSAEEEPSAAAPSAGDERGPSGSAGEPAGSSRRRGVGVFGAVGAGLLVLGALGWWLGAPGEAPVEALSDGRAREGSTREGSTALAESAGSSRSVGPAEQDAPTPEGSTPPDRTTADATGPDGGAPDATTPELAASDDAASDDAAPAVSPDITATPPASAQRAPSGARTPSATAAPRPGDGASVAVGEATPRASAASPAPAAASPPSSSSAAPSGLPDLL